MDIDLAGMVLPILSMEFFPLCTGMVIACYVTLYLTLRVTKEFVL